MLLIMPSKKYHTEEERKAARRLNTYRARAKWSEERKLLEREKYRERDRRRQYMRRYGITYNKAVEIKSKGCEVCGSFIKLCIDHCHTTKKVRGCLCDNCNVALGRVKDNVTRLNNLINYLNKYSKENTNY